MNKQGTKLVVLFFISVILSFCTRETPTENNINQPTAIPEGLKIFRAHDGEIGIEWIRFNEPALKGYNIYRAVNDFKNFKFYAFTMNNYFLDDTLEYDSLYYYKLTSVNNNGMESGFSESVRAKPINYYHPFPPFMNEVIGMNRNGRASIEIAWLPSASSDVKEYRIYRSESEDNFRNLKQLIGTSGGVNFTDSSGVVLLKKYYYSVTAVDKGELESSPTLISGDLVLDEPIPIYPLNQQIKSDELEFKFVTCGNKVKYKLFIQSDQYFDIVDILNISSDVVHDTISIPYSTLYLSKYKEYYWRVAAYTSSDQTANSFSGLNSFSIAYGNN